MLFVPQCRRGGKEETARDHKDDERQTEEKEGMLLDGGTVADGSLSGILFRLECRHSVDKKLSDVRRLVHCSKCADEDGVRSRGFSKGKT